MLCVFAALSRRAFHRFAAWFLLGFCLALWPIAGYAATLVVDAPADQINAPAQLGLVVTKSASTSQAAVGDSILYTYQITNSGTVTLTSITAVDDRLGAVAGLAGELAPAASRSATLTYVVQLDDAGGALVNTITVTATDSLQNSVTGSASASVTIIDPTSLPETEQPDQPSRIKVFLPSILP